MHDHPSNRLARFSFAALSIARALSPRQLEFSWSISWSRLALGHPELAIPGIPWRGDPPWDALAAMDPDRMSTEDEALCEAICRAPALFPEKDSSPWEGSFLLALGLLRDPEMTFAHSLHFQDRMLDWALRQAMACSAMSRQAHETLFGFESRLAWTLLKARSPETILTMALRLTGPGMGHVQAIEGFAKPNQSNTFERLGSNMLIRFAHSEGTPLLDGIELPRMARCFAWMRHGGWIDMGRIAGSLSDMLSVSFDLNAKNSSSERQRRRRWRQAVGCAFGADRIDEFAQRLSRAGALGAAKALDPPFEDIERDAINQEVQSASDRETKRL